MGWRVSRHLSQLLRFLVSIFNHHTPIYLTHRSPTYLLPVQTTLTILLVCSRISPLAPCYLLLRYSANPQNSVARKLNTNAVQVSAENPLPYEAEIPTAAPTALMDVAARFWTAEVMMLEMNRQVVAD